MKSKKLFVKRYKKVFRYGHWVNALAFFMLYLSGLPLYTNFFNFIFTILGGPENTRLVHRIFAVIFIVNPILQLIFDRESLLFWIKNVFTFKKKDYSFYPEFAKEFVGMKSNVPKQGFFNSGEKLNSRIQILAWGLLVISGIVTWIPAYFPKSLVQIMYPIHGISFGLATLVIIGHIYLSTLNPASKASLRGMIKGSTDINYIKHHHTLWYEELEKEGKLEQAIVEE